MSWLSTTAHCTLVLGSSSGASYLLHSNPALVAVVSKFVFAERMTEVSLVAIACCVSNVGAGSVTFVGSE